MRRSELEITHVGCPELCMGLSLGWLQTRYRSMLEAWVSSFPQKQHVHSYIGVSF